MTILKNTAKLSAGLLTATLVLAGCSNDTETEPTETETTAPTTEDTPAEEPTTEAPSEEPTTEAPSEAPSEEPTAASEPTMNEDGTFSGTGYTLTLPEGYTDTGQDGQWELMVGNAGGTGTMNIIVTPAGGMDLDSLMEQVKPALEGQMEGIQEAPEKTIDGSPARGYSGTITGVEVTQYYAVQNDRAYILSFGGDAIAEIDTFLSGWSWN
ncbi:MAG: hypothetical protein GXX86_12815 [Propionibacterium sp.]|nr:hypothetical protein [Propionibacterium sp.]